MVFTCHDAFSYCALVYQVQGVIEKLPEEVSNTQITMVQSCALVIKIEDIEHLRAQRRHLIRRRELIKEKSTDNSIESM